MHNLRNLSYILLEYAESIRVRDHYRSDILSHQEGHRIYINNTGFIGFQGNRVKSAHAHACGVCTVGRIRDQNLCTLFLFISKISAHDHHACQLAVSASGRLKGYPIHSRYLRKKTFKLIHYTHRPLSKCLGLEGVRKRESFKP